MAEYAEGETVVVNLSARDSTGTLLFDVWGGAGDSYLFNYEPPFTFVDEDEDGDLIVANNGGDFLAVSPEFVRSAEPKLGLSHDPVEHPAHYKGDGGMEAIDVIEAFDLNYRLGAAVKYILRAGKKGTPDDAVIDLRKCVWYVEREISARDNAAGKPTPTQGEWRELSNV